MPDVDLAALRAGRSVAIRFRSPVGDGCVGSRRRALEVKVEGHDIDKTKIDLYVVYGAGRNLFGGRLRKEAGNTRP